MGADKKEPQFSEEEKRAARALMDAERANITAARAQDPQDAYALGQAARTCFEDPNRPAKLGYPGSREMLNAELPRIGADVVMRAVLYVRLIDEGGLERPKGGLTEMIVEVPRPHGGTIKESFRRLSIEDLLRGLELLKRKNEPPTPVMAAAPVPPPEPAPKPAPSAVAPVAQVAPPPVPAPALAAPSPAPKPVPVPVASSAGWKRIGIVLAVAAAIVAGWRLCGGAPAPASSAVPGEPRR